MRKLRAFIVTLSGARDQILTLCPTERIKFESLGYAILITSGLATVSMWFALSSALGVNGVVAIVPALAWGLVIMGVDRWLVTSMPIHGRRKFMIAIPRLLLAFLLGALISTPLVLRIFQSEINAQISVIKQERYSTFLSNQEHSTVAQQVTRLSNKAASLQQVIDTRGQAPLNPSADSQVELLNSQLKSWQSQERYYYAQWQCQLYGGTGCTVKGNGPLAQAMHADYLNAVSKINTIQGEIRDRESLLASTSAAEEKSRYDQAVAALPGVQGQLSAAQARQSALQANFYAQNQDTNGILIRLQALSQLSAGDFTVTQARFLLFLLFLVIECLPVTVKLLQQPGIYEEILRTAQDSELGNARRIFRGRPALAATGATGATQILQLTAEPARADLLAIWDQRRWNTPPGPDGASVTEHKTEAPALPGTAEPGPYGDDGTQGAQPSDRHGDWGRGEDPIWRAPEVADDSRDEPDLRQTRPDVHYNAPTRGDGVFPPVQGVSPADSGELPVLDQPLRDMEDDRVPANSDGQGGGIALSWDEE